jgi:2-polyprenyl-6-methoxyphenol hydroxylase-like FAD-dependent oxidoreductase
MQNHQDNSTPQIDVASIDTCYDVVVVGARAAGAATAMLLARRGLKVLAVDRSVYGSDTLSTHSLAGAGVLQLSRWGLLDRIREAGTPVTNRVIFHYSENVVDIDIPARGDVDGLYSPPRPLLDRTLVDAAAESGAHVRHEVSLVRVTSNDAGRVDGVELDIGGRRRRVAARFVIGADGVRSRVARQVGAEVIRQETATSANVFAYFKGVRDDTIINHYSPGRVVGIIPCEPDVACLWVGMKPDEFDRTARGKIAEAHESRLWSVPQIAEHLLGAERISGYRAFPGTPGFTRKAWGDGWALVGDAGYFKDPVSAHGITDAFITAELLANSISDVVHRGVDEDCAFGHYERERDEMAAAMMPSVAAIAALPDDMTLVQQGFRGMSRAMKAEHELIGSGFGAMAAC